jgi:inner membrane protein
MVLVSVYPCITGYVYLLGTQILWPLDYRFALKTIFVVDPLYTIPLVIALIMVWKTKDAALQKNITKGLFISSFICFYLVL